MKTLSQPRAPAATRTLRTRASSSAVAPADTRARGRSRRSAAARRRTPAPPRSLTRFREGVGDPLLLIHGLGLSWSSWNPVLPILTRAHDVLALDLPGFGTAPPLRDQTPTVAALADAIEAELERSGLDRVHVAGNSLGGWIALELARRGRATSAVALSPRASKPQPSASRSSP
jgi:pimeloyl-ACP methyl ester carboxylesterase